VRPSIRVIAAETVVGPPPVDSWAAQARNP